jgi:preprotein translocase subunit SecE
VLGRSLGFARDDKSGEGQPMSVNRLVALFWLGATACIGIFLEKFLGDYVFGLLRLPNPTFFEWSLSTLLGFALAIAVAIVCWLNPRVRELAFEVAVEIKKVTWPTWPETRRNATAVLAMTGICALILGAFDTAGAKVMTGWLPHLISYVARAGR